jgi:hypothetical protein
MKLILPQSDTFIGPEPDDAAALAAHAGAADPHPGYTTTAELATAVALLPWGWLAYAETVTAETGLVGTVDLTDLAVTWTAVAGRLYKITGKLQMSVTDATPPGRLLAGIRESTTELQRILEIQEETVVTMRWIGQASWIGTPSPGSHTHKLYAQLVVGTSMATESSATLPSFILVEDIGPA